MATQNKKEDEKGTINKLYFKYEPLANEYANKLYGFKDTSMEKDDILQELKIKIYTSIMAYGRKWKEYRQTNRYKPVPLKYYLKSALSNRVVDMIKELNSDDVSRKMRVSINNESIDIGEERETHQIDFSKKELIINGIDLLQGLNHPVERQIFIMFAKGYSIATLKNIFRKVVIKKGEEERSIDVWEIIVKQQTILMPFKEKLFHLDSKTYQQNLYVEQD